MRGPGILVSISAALALGAPAAPSTLAAEPTAEAVLVNYADVAAAAYEDAWLTAQDLQQAVDAFLAQPAEATHQAAKDAWLAARVPFSRRRRTASAMRSSTTGRAR
jgi:putative iron-regulated protein